MTVQMITEASAVVAGITEPGLRVISLGGGKQSSCLLLMACEDALSRRAGRGSQAGLPPLDAAIFADTRHEMPETYRYLGFLQERAEAAGIRFIRASAGDLKADLIARQGKGMQPNLPVRVRDRQSGQLSRINAYRCSYDYKRRVIEREVKRLCGGRGAWKRRNVQQWLGMSTDETSRMKTSDGCRCGHNRMRRLNRSEQRQRGDGATVELIHRPGCSRCGCEKFDPWQLNIYPLIELRMSRQDCTRWIAEHGYPVPPRSACYFCPNRGDAHWRSLRDQRDECLWCGHLRQEHRTGAHADGGCAHLLDPAAAAGAAAPVCECEQFDSLWDRAVEVDEFVRHGMNEMDGEGFLHRSGVPLRLADLRSPDERERDAGLLTLFTRDSLLAEADTDCEAGVCFT